MGIETALIHTAQLLVVDRAAVRNAQGEYDDGVADPWGPVFDARIMEPRGGAAEQVEQPDARGRVAMRYEVLAAMEAHDGSPVVIKASSRILAQAGPLGQLELEVDGRPELLNNGSETIGWDAHAVLVGDAA